MIAFWDGQGGVPAWSGILLDKIKETRTDPVRASRALGLFHTAIADATIAVWRAKFRYRRQPPARIERRLNAVSEVDLRLPSYPSEHAAVAAAAAAVLNYLYPGQTALVRGQAMTFDAAANEATLSRLWAGAGYRSDLDPGVRIGRAAALLAVQRGASDGSAAVWDPVLQPGRRVGPQFWVPTPPAGIPLPLHPLAGYWRPWLLSSGAQFRALAPPALRGSFPSDLFVRETLEVKQAVEAASPEQAAIAQYWADDPGATFTPPGHWAAFAIGHVVAAGVSTPRAARALALLGAGLADSAIACWDAKYHFWLLRPITAIRTMSGQPFYDPGFLTPIATPPFPAYTSGHSTFSGCGARVLEHLFPNGLVPDAFGESVSFEAAAEQAAVSRVYGGIHYRSDSDEGLVCGRRIAELVLRRGERDGA
jgi:hypothetical protein